MAITLITGTSTGIALATAVALGRAGHHVYATMRNPHGAPELQILATEEALPIGSIEGQHRFKVENDNRPTFFKWNQKSQASFHMIESMPSSVELSPIQREILDLIIQDQTSIQGPVEPERAILLWSQGVSESTTAKRLGISEAEVRLLRRCWWASRARVAAAEKKLDKTFKDLLLLVFRIPNKEPPSETSSNPSADGVQPDHTNRGESEENQKLRAAARAVIEILH